MITRGSLQERLSSVFTCEPQGPGNGPLPQSYQHCDHNAQSRGASLSWNLSSERNAGDGQGFTVPLRQSPFLGQPIHPASQTSRMSSCWPLFPPHFLPTQGNGSHGNKHIAGAPFAGLELEESILWGKG